MFQLLSIQYREDLKESPALSREGLEEVRKLRGLLAICMGSPSGRWWI